MSSTRNRHNIQLAAFYFPDYHCDERMEKEHGPGWTEWDVVQAARYVRHREGISGWEPAKSAEKRDAVGMASFAEDRIPLKAVLIRNLRLSSGRDFVDFRNESEPVGIRMGSCSTSLRKANRVFCIAPPWRLSSPCRSAAQLEWSSNSRWMAIRRMQCIR